MKDSSSKTSNTDPANVQLNIRVCARHANAMANASEETMTTQGVLLRALIDHHMQDVIDRIKAMGVDI